MDNSARRAGFEKGIQRQLPAHPYLMRSTAAREFMEGFKAGRERRDWLNARGQRRTRTVVVRDPSGGWRWEFYIENSIHAQGWQRSEKAAGQAAENAAMDAVDAGLTKLMGAEGSHHG